MTQILIFIIVILVVAVVALFIVARRGGFRQAQDKIVGICEVAMETASEKQARKQKIVGLLEQKGEAGNEEIRKFLGVSSRTVVRYLDELEKEGRAEQVGKIGQSVTYRLR
ncbi:MAG: HTH domain-containing protein [Elusimicrobia bacterium]|nr:HTH domain-containing protein [Elusimicrobiota bacterium]